MTKHREIVFADEPYGLQQDIIDGLEDDQWRFLLAILGRQSGKSWLAKRVALDFANNKRKRVWWVATTYTSARTHWQSILRMLEGAEGSDSVGFPVKKINRQSYEIHFHGGGVLAVKTAQEPDNLRGDTLDLVILDEAAFYPNGRYIWESVIQPMITASRGKILITTTPNGRNWVWDLYKRGLDPVDKYYKSWHMPSTKAPYQDQEMLADIKRNLSERTWREEYLAEFLADGSGVFARVGEAATVAYRNYPEEGHTYIMGVDVGKSNDATCVTVIDKYTREQVYGKAYESIGTGHTVAAIMREAERWFPEVIVIEKNGVGEHLGGIIKGALHPNANKINIFGEDTSVIDFPKITRHHRVKLVHMNNESKRSYVEGLSANIEYGRLKILDPDTATYGERQISEMSTYEAKRTSSGLAVTYSATSGNHDDTISALYLANGELPKIKTKFRKHWEEKVTPTKSPFKNHTRPQRHRI